MPVDLCMSTGLETSADRAGGLGSFTFDVSVGVFESFVVIVLCFSCEAQRQLLVSVEISVNILCIVFWI